MCTATLLSAEESKLYRIKIHLSVLYFSLINVYCEANEEICKKWGINFAYQDGNTGTLLGEDDITILEACLITLGVIVGIGGLLGIFLLCCLRRRLVNGRCSNESLDYELLIT